MNSCTRLIILLCTILLLGNCRVAKSNRPSLATLQTTTTEPVCLSELLQSPRNYQGQSIETTGQLFIGSEDCSLHSFNAIPINDSIFQYFNFNGLGLELHPGLHLTQDSLQHLNQKWVTVRGIVDTMDGEKISGLPEKVLLKNVFYFQPIINK